VDLDDGFEGVHAHFMEDHVAQDTGIVHDTIESAEMIGRRLHDFARGDCFRHRLEISDRSAATLLDFFHYFLGRGCTVTRAVSGPAGIIDHDFCAFGRAKQRDLAPDATARAGNDDDFVLQ
jgi:hypothetical protein